MADQPTYTDPGREARGLTWGCGMVLLFWLLIVLLVVWFLWWPRG